MWTRRSLLATITGAGCLFATTTLLSIGPAAHFQANALGAGQVLTVNVPQAVGAKTVLGQLTVDRTTGPGFVTAYACQEGLPRDGQGQVSKSDLNFNGTINPVASNRLIVRADGSGNVCFYTSAAAELIIDINGVADGAITPISNQRTDTRNTPPLLGDTEIVRVNVAEATGRKTVFGQLTVDRSQRGGFVTAYGCADGIPGGLGAISKSDLNYNGAINPVASNRLVVQADAAGDVCFYVSTTAELIVDVNAVAESVIRPVSMPRFDSRDKPGLNGAGEIIRVGVTGAGAGATVFGQLTVDAVTAPGFVTAYGCADGIPCDANGQISKSDLNYDGRVNGVASNRLVVQADRDGMVCFYTLTAGELIIDIVGVSDSAIISFANQRTDTRPPPATVPPPPRARRIQETRRIAVTSQHRAKHRPGSISTTRTSATWQSWTATTTA